MSHTFHFGTERPEKWRKCLKLSVAFIAAMFFLGFLLGVIGGVADPDGGWAAWRVGLLVGAISAAVGTVIAFIGSIIHIGDS